MSKNQILVQTEPFKIYPDFAFSKWAEEFYQAYINLKKTKSFSPVPYFLICRSIELQIKALLINHNKYEKLEYKKKMKNYFGHNIVKAYKKLPNKYQKLTDNQFKEFDRANKIYKIKGFEYFIFEDALKGYKNFPKLYVLNQIAKKFLKIKVRGL